MLQYCPVSGLKQVGRLLVAITSSRRLAARRTLRAAATARFGIDGASPGLYSVNEFRARRLWTPSRPRTTTVNSSNTILAQALCRLSNNVATTLHIIARAVCSLYTPCSRRVASRADVIATKAKIEASRQQ